ncbi:hypothetical protein KKC08_04270 [Patescibacteria group bacterium]|nr:hypothetical protein [Patescibacteria group bacterium]MBU4430586.1 hypothetical protein [Patescibacteria group bacterium]MCG2702113.1 hypothetical protein [Candidatus Parcubacteria bacterium]
MSQNQLKALRALVDNKGGVIEAVESAKLLGLEGKALGGVFSSLSRQRIGDISLIEPRGRSLNGRGLRWKLNVNAISKDKLRKILKEIFEK